MERYAAAKTLSIALAILAGGACVAPPAAASLFTIDISQVADSSQTLGYDVVATGIGSIDLTGLSQATIEGQLDGSAGDSYVGGYDGVQLGPTTGTNYANAYVGSISAPANFGPGTVSDFTYASSGSGDVVGAVYGYVSGEACFLDCPAIYVPNGYISGDSLSATDTWDDATISSLGLIAGTYTWTWDDGNDSIVIDIEAPPVPEPASFTLLGPALFGLGAVRRRRKT